MNRVSPVRMLVPVVLGLLSIACGGNTPGTNPDAGDGVATLSWDAPTKDVNGEPLTDLQAYMVLYGRSPDDLKYWKRIEDKSTHSFVVTGLAKGVWYFSIVAINSKGEASAPSPVVSKDVQ